MKLDQRIEGGVIVLQATGRLDAVSAQEFERAILALLESETKPLLVNMAALEYISSAGLRALILALKKEEERKCGFGLCCLQENVADVLEIAGFISLFGIYETEQQGLDGLART